ncbi:FAD-binding oxidoreductase [Actinocatenispora rupis]|uniref:Oxidoreductase n=1 Tax=Actinocatenispora rupis TaxID=519421 RepID=A0A8J3J3V6_9ACTN|nr:FAD-dependent oxidoreductase [Actinocatenispora rupis]GID15311.1 oxidoreductase [Actinocatenispora rupis]
MAVVAARDVADIETLVRFAGEAGVPVAAQPGGHAPTAAQSGAIILRTAALDEVVLDRDARRVRAGAGVKWQAVLDVLDGTGLMADIGSNGDVSVVGYLLGGGMSWFSRAHGLAASRVVSYDVVDATGTARTVDADTDPELFWALRGGGGDFAVVTAVEFGLFECDRLYGGALHWPGARNEQVLSAYAAVTAAAPAALTLWVWWGTWPDVDGLPPEMRGQSFITVNFTYLGSAEDAEPYLAELRAVPDTVLDTTGDVQPSALPLVAGEGDHPRPAMDWAQLLSEVDGAVVTSLAKLTGPASGSPLIMCLRHLGGAFATDCGGAAGSITQPYLLLAFGMPMAPGVAEQVHEHWAGLEREFSAYLDGSTQCNMLGYEHRPHHAFPSETLVRLRDVKRRHDPRGTIRGNRPVLSD